MSYYVTTEKKSFIDHKEGDTWEESGKTWTIKNGVKKTVTKMDAFRKQIIIPIACKCGMKMQSPVHKWAWNTHKMCFNCVVDMEHEIQKAGKLEEYTKALYKANMESFYGDLEQFISEYSKETTSIVTGDGAKETWDDASGKVIEEIGNNELKALREKIDDI